MKYPSKETDSCFYFFTDKPFIFIESDEVLLSDNHYYNLWRLLNDLIDLPPRREMPNDMTLAFMEHYGRLYMRNGEPYELPDVDDIFPDAHWRWFSYYLEATEDGLLPRRKSRKVERLRLLNLWLKI